MATSQSQSFRGGSVSPGQGIHEDDIKTLVINRKTDGGVAQQQIYDPLQGNTFNFGRVKFKLKGVDVGSYDPFDAEKNIDFDVSGGVVLVFDPDGSGVMSDDNYTKLSDALSDDELVELKQPVAGSYVVWRVYSRGPAGVCAYTVQSDKIRLALIDEYGDGNQDHHITTSELSFGSLEYMNGSVGSKDLTDSYQSLALTKSQYAGTAISESAGTVTLEKGVYFVSAKAKVMPKYGTNPEKCEVFFDINGWTGYKWIDCSEPVGTIQDIDVSFLTVVNSTTTLTIQAKCDTNDRVSLVGGFFSVFAVQNAAAGGGGGGGSYTATYPLEIDGNDDIKLKYGNGLKVENNKLVVDEDAIEQTVADEIADIVNSRVMYTMDIGAITDAVTPSGNQSYCIGTLFNPNMDMEIDSNTNVIVATSQNGTGNHCYLALYELDLASGEYNWVANTADVNSDIHNTGYHHYKFAYVKDNKFKLKTNKMYYFCLIGDMNSVRFAGSPITEPFNTVPLYLCWYADNLVANGQPVPSDAASFQTQLQKFVTSISPTPADPTNGIFSVGGINQNRCFAAFTNITLN